MLKHPPFNAHVVQGSGKGSAQGFPTLNLDLTDIPADIDEGIYAGRVIVEGKEFAAAIHYGPRLVHGLGTSFEAHLLEVFGISYQVLGMVTVELVERLRDVRNFESQQELKKQIERDIDKTKEILSTSC